MPRPYQSMCFDTSQIPRLEPVGTRTHFSDYRVNQELSRESDKTRPRTAGAIAQAIVALKLQPSRIGEDRNSMAEHDQDAERGLSGDKIKKQG